jgi:hypothetical protein
LKFDVFENGQPLVVLKINETPPQHFGAEDIFFGAGLERKTPWGSYSKQVTPY